MIVCDIWVNIQYFQIKVTFHGICVCALMYMHIYIQGCFLDISSRIQIGAFWNNTSGRNILYTHGIFDD